MYIYEFFFPYDWSVRVVYSLTDTYACAKMMAFLRWSGFDLSENGFNDPEELSKYIIAKSPIQSIDVLKLPWYFAQEVLRAPHDPMRVEYAMS